MSKLKLGPIAEDKPVKITLDLPGALHRDLSAYAEALGRESASPSSTPKSSSFRCSNGSWQPTEGSPRRAEIANERNPDCRPARSDEPMQTPSSAFGSQTRGQRKKTPK